MAIVLHPGRVLPAELCLPAPSRGQSEAASRWWDAGPHGHVVNGPHGEVLWGPM